ncbi:MAG: N-acetylmuramoyl-L-alanine amidase [Bacillota bacterium]|nr:N-acetylmuramoyl-L-alanine amidase [Bacillota bacterium]
MNKPVVLLDPGHGGYDPGAAYNGLKEKDLNLMLALKVAERLDGVKVLLTRERDSYVSLSDRVALSRRAEPDLFLSLHANAGGGRGFESFIYRGLGAMDPAVKMQEALHKRIMDALGRWQIVDRGRKTAAFYVLKYNSCPAVLIESLFLDNVREAGIWREPVFADTLAGGVVKGIEAALGVDGDGDGAGDGKVNTPTPTLPSQGGVSSSGGNVAGPPTEAPAARQRLYTVQVGAFAYLENARQRLAEAQAAGFNDAYIYQKMI